MPKSLLYDAIDMINTLDIKYLRKSFSIAVNEQNSLSKQGVMRCRWVVMLLLFMAYQVLANNKVEKVEYEFDISEVRLDIALNRLAQQTNTPLLFSHEEVRNVQPNPVVGRYTIREALAILLNNTGITGNINDQGVLTVMRAGSELNEGDNMKFHKKRLTGLAAVLAVLLGSPGAVQAQDDGDAMEEVVVTGIRGSLQQSLTVKRNSPNFVDAITAEDIGKFPDLNLADSLSRIPGITIERGFNGIPSNVSVRGVGNSFTLTLLNGQTISSVGGTSASGTGGNRIFDFGIMASELIGSVEVSKTVSAGLQEGGVGGTINVKLREPLDQDEGFHGTFSGQAAYDDLLEKTSPRLSGLVSWKNEADTFGVLASYSSYDFVPRTDGIETFGYADRGIDTDDDGVADDTIFAPGEINFISGEYDIERTGISLSAQWQPSDNFELIGTFLRADIDSFGGNQNASFHYSLDVTGPYRNVERDSNGTFSSGEFDALIRGDTGTRNEESRTDFYFIEAEYNDDLWLARANFTYSKATYQEDNAYSIFQNRDFLTTLTPVRIYRVGDRLAGDTLDPNFDFAATLNNIGFGGSLRTRRENEDLAFSLDLERQLSGAFNSVEFGVKYRDNAFRNRYGQLLFQDDPQFTQVSYESVETGFGGSRYNDHFSGPGRFTNRPRFDPKRYYDAVINLGDFPDHPPSGFAVDEQTFALYTQLNIDTEVGGLPLRGDIGLRYVDQSREVDSVVHAQNNTDFELSPVIQKGGSDFILPSLNLVLNLQDDLQVRFGAGKTVIFPNYPNLNSNIRVSPDGRTASAGNPDLQPFEATGIDLGLEWYPAPGVALTGALFYKDYDAFPVTVATQEDLGALALVRVNPECCLVSRPYSDGSGDINGVELNIQGDFLFLPGIWQNFGAIVNATFVDGELDREDGSVAIVGQSDESYNVTLYYEDGRLSTRLNYTWRSDYTASLISAVRENQITREYGQLDFSASYELTDNFSLVFDAINLNEEDIVQLLGDDRPTFARYHGRRFLLGARYVF